jgi:uncharacterized protein (DUF58 family)
MTTFPDGRLVRLVAAWTVAGAAAVVWPALLTVWGLGVAALAAAALADLVALVRTPPIRATRTLPEHALAGRDALVAVTLANPGPRPATADVIDELPVSIATIEPRHADVRIAPGASITLEERIVPAERGDLALGPVILLERSPGGLWRRRHVAATGDVLCVHADASRYLRSGVLRPRRVLATLGVRPARERGTGMEFESLRDYVVGDDVRRVDWAATARRGRPVTRLYQHERNRSLLIALDASRLMASIIDGRTKLDFAVDAALALAYGAIAAGDRVGMIVFDDGVRAALDPAPRRHLGPFVELLRTVRPRLVESSYVSLARRLAAGRQRRALVVVLGDFVDADVAALVEPLAVVARHHRVLFAAIRDRLYGALAPAADDDALAPYRRLVLDELLADREATLLRLRRAGLETLDLPPERITAPVLNAYLAMRPAAA